MTAVIYLRKTAEIIAEAATPDELRPQAKLLRDQGVALVLGTGETRIEAIAAATRSAGRAVVNAEKKAAVERTLPPIIGQPELTHEQWASAMEKLSPLMRGRAANLAAHSWAVIDDAEGLLLVAHQNYGQKFAGETQTLIEGVPSICHTCIHTERFLSTKGAAKPLKCDLGYEQGGGLREVGRIQSCTAWKLGERR